jgi:cysteine desulfurase
MSPIAPPGKEVYADHASFSPVDGDVLSAMLPYYEAAYGNPSSLHHHGRKAGRALRVARERIASVLSVKPEEILFTGSGTEANNLAIVGAAKACRLRGNHVIVSAIEHPSVVEAAKSLEKEGFSVSHAPVRPDGTLDVEACVSLISEKTVLVSVMYVNNEVGTVQPIRELSRRIRECSGHDRPLIHTDACQAANVFPVSPAFLGADLMTLNSTKVAGPSGIGLLYKREGVRLEPLSRGGEQEQGLRAGTESLPLAVGFSLALAKAQHGCKKEYERLGELRSHFVNGLKKRIPGIRIHGDGDESKQSPAIVHVTVPRIEGEAMLLLLDSKGIYASTGSACASLRIAPSPVLLAIGHDADSIHGSLRFSFGKGTTKEDVDYILESFPVVTERLCSMSALKEKAV